MNGIFISYRRDDSSGYAGRLYDRLAAHFGADRVFMDVEGIEPGADFVDAIDRAIATCAILIVIIGKEWLAADSSGHRRIDDAADFVRVETVMALSRGIRVVPVLVDGADMPRIEELPMELAPLVRRQAVDLSHKQWDATSAELIRTLEKILDHSTVPPASAARAGTQARGDPHSRAPPALSRKLPGEAESSAASTASADTPRARTMVIGGVIATITVLAAIAIFALRWHGAPPVATPPMLVATPEQVQFAEAPLHSTPVPAEVTLQNRGGSGMHVRQVRIDGAHAADFTLLSDQCSGRELPPAASCTVNVSFVATLAGARTAALLIQYDEARGPVVIGLQGHGAPPVIASAASPAAGPAPPGATPGEQAKPAAPPARTSDAPAASTQAQPAVGVPTRPGATPAAPPRGTAARPPPPVTAETTPAVSAKTASPMVAPATVPVQPGAQASSGLPRVGDNWQYRYRSMWRNVEPRTYAHQINASSLHEVRETMTFSSNGTTISDTKSFSADTRLVEWRGQGYYIVEFNPFLQALGELQPGMAWKSLATPVEDSFVGGWYTQGRALGWETVSVPAGTFKALRVEINSNRNARANAVSDPARVLYVIWYAPEARRAIRHVRIVFTSSGGKIAEDTFELMQYALK